MISKCGSTTDANQKELVSHGTIQFPLACYYDDMEKNAIAWHWHDEFEIIVCTSGKAILNMVQNKIILKNNDAVFINSRALHSLEKSNGKIKSILKTSPIQYIKKVRIEKACEMLSSTKEKISTIALNCGFNDMSYFSKSFKEQMRITPEEFRKSIA